MGTFISNDDLQPKDIVNSYVKSYLSGTEKYSKFQSGAPSFVTYYSKDFDSSTSDMSLDNVEEIIGYNSPIRYNKLKDFPLYSVNEIDPMLEFNEDVGISHELETEAVILPGTIEPLPDDFVIFQYHSKDEDKTRLYRVTNVNMTSLESSSYYKISLSAFDVPTQDIEEQVSNTYSTLFSNIGTENKSLILEEDLYEVNGNIGNYEELCDKFIDYFYNRTLNTFIFEEDVFVKDSKRYIDLNLSRFIYDENLLIKSNSYISNILPYKDRNPKNDRMNIANYNHSLFNKLARKEELPNVINLSPTKDSFLKMFREKYIEINYLREKVENDKMELPEGMLFMDNITQLNRVKEDYQKDKSLNEMDIRFRLITNYLMNEKLENKQISKVIEYFKNKHELDIIDYLIMPCIMYIIKNSINDVFKK